jgi:hypothetical protein
MPIVIDCETYPNYFLLAAMCTSSGKVRTFEIWNGEPFDARTVTALMRKHTTISFNGLGFDIPLIVAACSGFSTAAIYKLSQQIIVEQIPAWRVARDAQLITPADWDHIDLIDVAPGKSSLKIYGGRLHSRTMQDLPYFPGSTVTPEMRAELLSYCANDLRLTAELYRALLSQIELRAAMSRQYGLDLRSKSDAQIAESVLLHEVSEITGRSYRKPEKVADAVRYVDPGFVEFNSPQLRQVFARVLAEPFAVGGNGAIVIPEWLRETKIQIGQSVYQMGIGGLHSCESAQTVRADADHDLIDLDVASYYPSIILQAELAPPQMGDAFLQVYRSIVDRRIAAKRSGDKVTADTLKIAVNGSFGKLGSKYSALYAPELLIQTTISGQMALLMLIEALTAAGATVVSANTDGVVSLVPKACARDFEIAAFDWQLLTGFVLERTDYRVLASRDVNSYVAVTTGGKIKGKGIFAPPSLSKNPDCAIIPHAVAQYVAHGTPIADTVNGCDDLRQFVTVRRVQGGAVWRGAPLGKAVRFYKSSEIPNSEAIHYATNSNRVPRSNGCRPCMTLPEVCPDDIDRPWYIAEARELLRGLGHA